MSGERLSHTQEKESQVLRVHLHSLVAVSVQDAIVALTTLVSTLNVLDVRYYSHWDTYARFHP